ncbi:hypothetical protein Nepgr_019186 [Nepenthes gracilis]|uniref:ZF-HD dimerization-type domain-containing protein n=1 Tax=Nepenthes gracilis TaxID=150966 RepID=A0AAD3ST17_NEPGR|nr:hypothetical protein Nepgr_019186 [Nepenthes gracilis]
MDLSVEPYGSENEAETFEAKLVQKSRRFDTEPSAEPAVVDPTSSAKKVRYAECMRNHAASIGGHANDGCGEFMGGATVALICAACGCHRNFHRREVPCDGGGSAPQPLQLHHRHHHRIYQQPHQLVVAPLKLRSPPPHLLVPQNAGLTSTWPGLHPDDHYYNGFDDAEGDCDQTPEREDHVRVGTTAPTVVMRSKRFRTKFTQEQKDRMQAHAEKLGWRIQRHDDVALNEFCAEIGVSRNVFKVWMHNNKNNALCRKDSAPSPGVAPPPPLPSAPPQSVGV